MKICLPTMGENGLTETVHNHFGSALYFTIYDTESKDVKIIANDNQHHTHGTCQPLGMLCRLGIDAVMTNGIGRRAIQLLNEGNIKVYQLEGETVQEAIRKFEANELMELTTANACGGHGCHD